MTFGGLPVGAWFRITMNPAVAKMYPWQEFKREFGVDIDDETDDNKDED